MLYKGFAFVKSGLHVILRERYITTVLHKYLKYITVYRGMLIALLLPGIVIFLLGGEARKVFVTLYLALAGFTFLVEILLFVFQFTRRENTYVEISLLLMALIGAFVFL